MFDLSELRTVVKGRVLLKGDYDFEIARRSYNLAVSQPVDAVVEVSDVRDVTAVVRYAGEHGLSVTVQPSGHGATGDVGSDGVILLRTSRLDRVDIDPDCRTARVGAGVRWGQVQTATAAFGLTGLPGSSPEVSVAGYTLGGGLSWLGRKYGWAADSVTAFDVVDADGAPARVTAETDADLFWALRGGGGDFAIVTSIEFDLHPAPDVFGGTMLWPGTQQRRVLETFGEVTAPAPEELTVWFDLLYYPGTDPMVAVHATYLGDPDTARALLRPFEQIEQLIADDRRTMQVSDLGTIMNEPPEPSPGSFRGELLTDLDDVVAKTLLAEPIAPLLNVQVRHLGGAFTRPSNSPHGSLTAPYSLHLFGELAPDESGEAVYSKQRTITTALAEHIAGHKPFTLLAPGETVRNAFTEEVLTRLQTVKRRCNPGGLIRSNFPCPAGNSQPTEPITGAVRETRARGKSRPRTTPPQVDREQGMVLVRQCWGSPD
jgi:hypothetical protein